MKKEEFLKLQIGQYITDHQDINNPENYCRIMAFKPGMIQLQPYERYNKPANANPFWEPYASINITEKLMASEYYALCRL